MLKGNRYKTPADLETHRNTSEHKELFKTFEEEEIFSEFPTMMVGKAIGGHFDR